ncbi:hypothetical protein GW626_19845 [Peribacillus muralis]|uniref:hypothetical protein n=1 Tax=Peribacillus muralis TaxID=264697 RepID=UPI001F4D3DB1|nr:hypothetical protein [Peribacillus muralis]MCK1994863.1 hypothetical protein [Peribacillus muralis]MCK2015310.1 hypothetical protein [Peribacillus muralis]
MLFVIFYTAGYVAILIDSVFGNGRLRLIEISFPITLIGAALPRFGWVKCLK